VTILQVEHLLDENPPSGPCEMSMESLTNQAPDWPDINLPETRSGVARNGRLTSPNSGAEGRQTLPIGCVFGLER
jgi:hypothetical protein